MKTRSVIDKADLKAAGSAIHTGSPISNGGSVIDFDKFHSALRAVNLMNCRGSIVRVAGLTAESTGPKVGLGELCGIEMADGRQRSRPYFKAGRIFNVA